MESFEHKTAARIVVFIISFYLMWILIEYMVNLPETMVNYWKAWVLALINYILGSLGIFKIFESIFSKYLTPR